MSAVVDRANWLAERRTGVGGSDVAGILGLSTWASPYSVWASKVMDLPDDQGFDDDREFGRRAEPMILDWFQDKTGLFARDRQQVVRHPKHPHFLATLDGRAYESWQTTGSFDDAAIAVVEAKSTRDSVAEWEAGIPIAYRCQTVWQMYVTGLTHAFVPTLHRFSGQFRLYELDLDPADVEFVVGRVSQWWETYVVAGVAPPVDNHPATTATIKAQWPTPEGSVYADDEARDLVARLNAHKMMAKAVDSNVATAENELRVLLGDREALVDGFDHKGRPKILASWKAQTAHRLDVDALRKSCPDLAREFDKQTTTRVLRVSKPQGD